MNFRSGRAKLFSCFVLLLLTSEFSYGQRDSTLHWSIAAGGAKAIGEELCEVYNLGAKISTGISFPLINRTIRLRPNIAFNYFGNNYSEGARDNLLFWNLGMHVQPNTKANGKAKFIPFAGAFYLAGNSYLAPRKDYSGDRVDLFTYKGIGVDLGFRIQFKSNLFLAVALDLVKPSAKVSDDILLKVKEELDIKSEIYDVISIPDTKLSFNNLNVSLGYNFLSNE